MQFIPILKPVLERGVDEIIYDDIRETCETALATLKQVMGAAAEKEEISVSFKQMQDILVDAITSNTTTTADTLASYPEISYFVAGQCLHLVENDCLEVAEWTAGIVPYLSLFMSKDDSSKVVEVVKNVCKQYIVLQEVVEEEGEDICNTEFSLAYGGKILLHNTKLHLKRGRRYGMVGKNGVGKTTLMRNIASKSVEGLPEELSTVYVQSNIDVEEDMSCKQYLARAPELKNCTAEELDMMLTEVGFDDDLKATSVFSLSGGWRMKLALARAMLVKPDMLLLDEPTNHLDVNAVAWLTKYLLGLKEVTCMIVSHSTSFCDDVLTDVLHYENQKLVKYHGNLAAFVAKKPEAKSYYALEADTLVFNFPVPGRLDGVKSKSKKIVKMEKCTFTYPGATKPQLNDCTCSLSLGSRVAVLGANGAGKSTLIKMLVGDTTPDTGEVWKHHNVRIAYVAQHSFHHVEQHMDESPVAYIQWRFASGTDRELLDKDSLKLTAEEEANQGKTMGQVEALLGRRTRSKELEYEVKFVGRPEKDNRYWTRAKLIAEGYEKLVKQTDERIASEEAGLDLRPLTTKEIQRHLDDFGLPMEFGTYGKIAGLSGGQKVKLVLASAMWNCPHLMVLDEPTNFLDREALGALATALKNFGGGVIMISHDREFYSALCTETWKVENQRLYIEGESGTQDEEVEVAKKRVVEEELTTNDLKELAGGNTNVIKEKEVLVDFWGKPLSKKEIRAMQKKGKA
jgi:elongation factor 3